MRFRIQTASCFPGGLRDFLLVISQDSPAQARWIALVGQLRHLQRGRNVSLQVDHDASPDRSVDHRRRILCSELRPGIALEVCDVSVLRLPLGQSWRRRLHPMVERVSRYGANTPTPTVLDTRVHANVDLKARIYQQHSTILIFWRRERDSNPRYPPGSVVFRTSRPVILLFVRWQLQRSASCDWPRRNANLATTSEPAAGRTGRKTPRAVVRQTITIAAR